MIFLNSAAVYFSAALVDVFAFSKPHLRIGINVSFWLPYLVRADRVKKDGGRLGQNDMPKIGMWQGASFEQQPNEEGRVLNLGL